MAVSVDFCWAWPAGCGESIGTHLGKGGDQKLQLIAPVGLFPKALGVFLFSFGIRKIFRFLLNSLGLYGIIWVT